MREETVVDAKTQTMRCEICGDEVPIPLGAIDWVACVMKAFAKTHKKCDGGKGRTGFSTPTIETNGGKP